jgi:hypothetical protein
MSGKITSFIKRTYDMLPDWVRKRIDLIKEGEPGRRFFDYYERFRGEKTTVRMILLPLFALVLILVAIILSVLPGPAWAFFLLALAILLARFPSMARFMDRLELKVRYLLKGK